MTNTKIKDISMISIYCEDFTRSVKFYTEILGLEKAFDMGSQACLLRLNDSVDMYLQGGNKRVEYTPETMRSSFTFGVKSATELFEKLTDKGIRTVHPKPIEMGPGAIWFQFFDPDGNILEVLGEE